MASIDLPDINVLFALTYDQHVHHARANQYWRSESADSSALTSQTQLGLARLLTNRVAMEGQPRSVAETWAICLGLAGEEAVRLLPDPAGSHDILSDFVEAGLVRPRDWADAYLAAVAKASGARLVSFDSDFHRYTGLSFLHLAE